MSADDNPNANPTPSTNPRAERVMGKRRDNTMPFDYPAELGYRCPICKNLPTTDDEIGFDERLHWSEYNGFLWCEVCDFDYPTALCVRLDAEPDHDRPWVRAGRAAAVDVFLDSVMVGIGVGSIQEDLSSRGVRIAALLMLGDYGRQPEAGSITDPDALVGHLLECHADVVPAQMHGILGEPEFRAVLRQTVEQYLAATAIGDEQ